MRELRAQSWRKAQTLGGLGRSARALMPAPLKSAARWLYVKTPYSWRAGATFRRTSALLERSRRWGKDRILEYQMGRLKDVVLHAAANVPGYGRRFAEYGVTPSTIKTLEDIRKLPCLTKDDLRTNPEWYVARNIPRERLQHVTSGGTTGAPVGFCHVRGYNEAVADAFKLSMWKRIGYSPALRAIDLTSTLEGNPAVPCARRNVLYVSIACLDADRFPSYAQTVRKFRPRFIIGFPSSVAMFAQLLRDSGTDGLDIKGVITASEVLYEHQRRYISERLGCRVLDWYGLAEYCGFASGCEGSDHYHFCPEAGYVELLDSDGLPVEKEGEEGEIVLTGFHNWATPFIRYRTGDRGLLGKGACKACGRSHTLLERISGRLQEYLVAGNGRLVPNTALNLHSSVFDEVLCYQFYQDTPGEIVLSIVRKPSYDPAQTDLIRRTIEQRLGRKTALHIRFVDQIGKTGRGKHRFIVQKLPIEKAPGGPCGQGRDTPAISVTLEAT